MSDPSGSFVHQLKISLYGAKPPIWRRVLVPSEVSLGTLHDIVQMAFGWDGFHLHVFEDGSRRRYGVPRESGDPWGPPVIDEEQVALAGVLGSEGSRLEYTYDFGDDWVHRIEAEKILPAEAGASYPRCVQGRRADPPAEDIGGIWGLHEIVELVDHPELEVPEHHADLVGHLRKTGWDPAAFNREHLDEQLSGLRLRTPSRAAGRRGRAGGSRGHADALPRVPGRLTEADLENCTCGMCRVGDPVRSLAEMVYDGDPVSAADEAAPPLSAVELPPRSELAAAVRDVPLVADAVALGTWCAAGRQVTATGVLRPAVARRAVEETGLWRRDAGLHDQQDRAARLAGLRSAGDLGVLDVPWRFACDQELIEIRSGKAWPGPGLPGSGDDDELLACWQEGFENEVHDLAGQGGRILPGLLGSVVGAQMPMDGLAIVLLELLYRVPGDEWLGTGAVVREMARDGGAEGTLLSLLVGETLHRLTAILEEFGAAEVTRSAVPWRGEYEVMSLLVELPAAATAPDADDAGDLVRLTPLGRFATREILLEEGFAAPLLGEHTTSSAAVMLDAVRGYDQESGDKEIERWRAARTGADAATSLLEACDDPDPRLAGRRASVLTLLSEIDDPAGLEILRRGAGSEQVSRRAVAVSALLARGERPDDLSPELGMWQTVDLCAAACADDVAEALLDADGPLLRALTAQADELWRSAHPATVDTLEAVASLIRRQDKALAKRLRRSAMKARSRS